MLVLLVVLVFAAFKIYTGNYYAADEAAIADLAKELSEEVHSYEAPEGTVFLPQNQDYKAVIVFYPGAKVEYTAYSGLMYRLAERGYICLLPKMADNVALLSVNAVDTLKAARARYEDQESVDDLEWYIAGHSLGGCSLNSHGLLYLTVAAAVIVIILMVELIQALGSFISGRIKARR